MGFPTRALNYTQRFMLKGLRVARIGFKPMTINDFSGYNQPYHPSVLYLEKGLFGHKYWMAQTPYPIGGLPYRDRWECPCIYWSNDGIKWETNKTMNPLDDLSDSEISNGDYFSDPHLVYRSDTNELECWYRITHMNRNITDKKFQYPTYVVRKTTKDGVHWSERELLIDLQSKSNFDDMVRSPAILWDNEKKIYRMWYVDTLPTLSNRNIVYAERMMALSGEKTITKMDYYIDPWHIDVNFFDGKYHLINYTLTGNQGLNYYESENGIEFNFFKVLLEPGRSFISGFYRANLYRSCSIKAHDGIRVYFSASDGLKTSIGVLRGKNFRNLKMMNIK